MITLFDNFKFYKKGLNITYSGVILTPESRNLLLSTFVYPNSEFNDWLKISHHMTICLGELPEHLKKYWLDEEITLTVTEIGISDKAIAVKDDGFFIISKSSDLEDEMVKFPHITLAINPFDAKPVDSNKIVDWSPVDNLKISGVVKEIQL